MQVYLCQNYNYYALIIFLVTYEKIMSYFNLTNIKYNLKNVQRFYYFIFLILKTS